MAYQFHEDDLTVGDGVRRIAVEQIDRALGELDNRRADYHKTIHEVRKVCKKVRGLIRLVRPAFAGYATENAAFRDAARGLSRLRDTSVLIASYDKLRNGTAPKARPAGMGSVRRRLTARRKKLEQGADVDACLAAFRSAMAAARPRAENWSLSREEFCTIRKGALKTCKRAGKAMTAAREEPTPENLHEWRKRVKYHWYHARLLLPMWPQTMKAHCRAADALGELLGEHHDLAVLHEAVSAEPDAFGKPAVVDAFLALIRRRQKKLEAKAFSLGTKLFAESPEDLVGRWETYWHEWRSGREPGDVIAA